jgi:hypothetical protein
MKKLLACAALLLAANIVHAQGVGINATGAAADTSAILDLSSTSKGLLVPRLTTAQRAAIVLPATGLVVYQTDGTTGLYWNAGTPASPSWKLVGEAGAGGGGQWTASGSNIYYSAGKVAVGTTPTQFRFTVQDTGSVFRVQSNNTTGLMASLGGYGQVQVDAPGVAGGRLALLGNGNLGLGVTNPTNKLSFAPVLGKKISLYPGATGDVGFGVAGNRLQIYADSPNADVALGYDAAGVFNERFAFKPNGALAVNGNTGAAGQVLQSGGSGAAAAWVNPARLYYGASTQTLVLDSGTSGFIPGLATTVTTSTAMTALVSVTIPVFTTECFACGFGGGDFSIMLDGVAQNLLRMRLVIGADETFSATQPVTLSAGTHSIDVLINNVGPNFAGYGGWFDEPTRAYLTVQVFPQ